MSFNHAFDSKKMDYSRSHEIDDTKLNFAAHATHIFNFTVKNIDLKTNHFKGIEMVCRLNSILKTLTNKDLECRLQDRLPYLLEQEATGSSFFDQVRDHTHIEFDNLPDKCHPVLEKDLTQANIDEIIKTQLNTDSAINIIEILGQYSPRIGFHSSSEVGEPSISIDIDKIDKISGKPTSNNLAVIVLVHELCHALLDPNNYYRYTEEGTKFIAPKIKYETAYGCLKEEVIANAMTYRYIKRHGDKALIKEANSFMPSQPDAYLYGYLMAKNRRWDEENAKEEWINEKINGSDKKEQQKWLESMIDTLKSYRSCFTK